MSLLSQSSLVITPNGYKEGKLYSVVPNAPIGDSTFARATTATRVNSEGLIEEVGLNVPRVDYPVLGGCPSLLLEPQRTNLLSYSEEFDNASWLKTPFGTGTVPVVTANMGLSPNGSMTADRVKFNLNGGSAINDVSVIQKTVSVTSGAITTKSIYIKSFDGTSYDLVLYETTLASGTNIKKITVTSEWQRFDIFGNVSSTTSGITFGLRNIIVTGISNTADVLVWGAQLEQGSYPTSYIPTLASAVTRNTDVLSNDMTATVDSTYTALLDVSATDSRLKIEDGTTGFDLPLNGSGRIVMVVDSDIKFYFPDNGQATTVLTYAKPSDLRNIDVLSKINETKIKVIAVENGVALQSRIDSWVSGSVSSYFLETDWAARTSFDSEFRDSDWDYFPLIDTSSGTNFSITWFGNNLTSFPLIDTSNGTNFRFAWYVNNLTSFPLINTSNGTNFERAWQGNNLTSFPLIDTSNGTNFNSAWRDNNLTSFPKLNMDKGTDFFITWTNNNLTTWLPNYFDTCVGTNFTRAWENNAIDQIGVDNILVSINTARLAGVQTGTIKVIEINGGTNATPSATGQAATDALRADGWIVSLNGY